MRTSTDPVPDLSAGTRESRDRELFDGIAEAYCRKDLLSASRWARRHRLMQTVRRLPRSEAWRVLDVGCGAGFSATYLRGRYASYVGIDPSRRLIEIGERYNRGPGVSFEVTPVASYNPAEPFDLVLMIGALHHMPEPEGAVERVVTMLRPGGWLAINEPQRANPVVSWLRATRKRVSADYSEEQDELSARRVETMFRRAGLERCEVTGQGLLSTPVAEVVLRPVGLMRLLVGPLCRLDAWIERSLPRSTRRLAWNLIAVGRKPD